MVLCHEHCRDHEPEHGAVLRPEEGFGFPDRLVALGFGEEPVALLRIGPDKRNIFSHEIPAIVVQPLRGLRIDLPDLQRARVETEYSVLGIVEDIVYPQPLFDNLVCVGGRDNPDRDEDRKPRSRDSDHVRVRIPEKVDDAHVGEANPEREHHGAFRIEIYAEDDGQDIEEWKDFENAMRQREDCGEDCTDIGSSDNKKLEYLLILAG